MYNIKGTKEGHANQHVNTTVIQVCKFSLIFFQRKQKQPTTIPLASFPLQENTHVEAPVLFSASHAAARYLLGLLFFNLIYFLVKHSVRFNFFKHTIVR